MIGLILRDLNRRKGTKVQRWEDFATEMGFSIDSNDRGVVLAGEKHGRDLEVEFWSEIVGRKAAAGRNGKIYYYVTIEVELHDQGWDGEVIYSVKSGGLDAGAEILLDMEMDERFQAGIDLPDRIKNTLLHPPIKQRLMEIADACDSRNESLAINNHRLKLTHQGQPDREEIQRLIDDCCDLAIELDERAAK